MNRLLIALEGRLELLVAIFGKSETAAPERKPMRSESFRAFAARHNARYATVGKPRRGS